MPLPALAIPLITAGAGILSGIFGSHHDQAQTQTTGTDPRFQGFEGALLKQIASRFTGTGLPPGFEEAGVGAINRASAGGEAALRNRLTSLGLGGSPDILGAGISSLEEGRIGQVGQFLANAPLKGEELRNQNLQLGLGLLGQNRVTNTTGQTSTNPLAGGLDNLAGLMPLLFPDSFPGATGDGGSRALPQPRIFDSSFLTPPIGH